MQCTPDCRHHSRKKSASKSWSRIRLVLLPSLPPTKFVPIQHETALNSPCVLSRRRALLSLEISLSQSACTTYNSHGPQKRERRVQRSSPRGSPTISAATLIFCTAACLGAPAEESAQREDRGSPYPCQGNQRCIVVARGDSGAIVPTTEERLRSANSTAASATLAMSSGVSSAYIGSEMILCA